MNLDLLWPTLKVSKDADNLQNDLGEISQADPGHHLDTALDEARRLYDQEQQRRSSADNKGGLYLGVATAFLASIITLSPLAIGIIGKSSSLLNVALSSLMVVTMAMSALVTFRCILWSKDALKVTSYHTLNWKDLIHSVDEKIQLNLFHETLRCLCHNDVSTNKKVTSGKMAEGLLQSAWFWLILSLLVRLCYHLVGNSFDAPETIINVISLCPELS